MSSTTEMPARYQLNTIRMTARQNNRDSGKLTIPTAAIHGWLGLGVGDTVGIAPKGPRSLKIGPDVPRFLTERRVVNETTSTDTRGRLRLYATCCRYFDLEPGDEFLVKRNGESGPIIVTLESEVSDR